MVSTTAELVELLRVSQDDDDVFVGAHPTTTLQRTFGGQVSVPVTGGGTVTLKIPAGTANGRTFRVRGKGVTRKDGTKGDLLATVDVQVPSGLTDEAREALERFVEASGGEDPRKDLLEAAKGS